MDILPAYGCNVANAPRSFSEGVLIISGDDKRPWMFLWLPLVVTQLQCSLYSISFLFSRKFENVKPWTFWRNVYAHCVYCETCWNKVSHFSNHISCYFSRKCPQGKYYRRIYQLCSFFQEASWSKHRVETNDSFQNHPNPTNWGLSSHGSITNLYCIVFPPCKVSNPT